MYQDQDSIRLFERQHARDRIVELARQCQDPASLDVFETHAKAERTEGTTGVLASGVAVLALIAAFALYW